MTVGPCDGILLPSLDGVLLDIEVGINEAFIDGDCVILNDGVMDGTKDTTSDGACVSPLSVGKIDGDNDGELLSALDGALLKSVVGLDEAFVDGISEGFDDGSSDGMVDTVSDGDCVSPVAVGPVDSDGELL